MVRRRRRRGRLIAGIAVAVVLLGGGAAIANGRRAQPPPEGEIVEVVRRDLVERVSATGNVVPPTARQLDFAAGGDIVEVAVAAGDRVTAGQLLGRVDDADLRQAVTTTQAELAAAEARLAQARAGATGEDRDAAAATVEQAEVGLDGARRSLASAQRTAAAGAGSRQAALDQARAERDRATAEAHAADHALAQARAALHAAEAAAPPDPAAVAAAQEAVTAAEQRAAAAGQSLDAAAAAVRSAEAEAEVAAAQEAAQEAAARSEVEAAAASLEAAEASAAQATQDPRPEAIEEAEAAVTTARATHEGALRDLAGAVVTAPADGLVTEVNGRVGEPSGAAAATVLTGDGGAGAGEAEGAATSGSSFVTLVDAAVREVRVGFPEIDAARLEAGQPAEVTFDAIEGPPVGGRVVAVDPSSSTVNNVVTYYARVALDTVPEGVRLGMTATAEVEVRTVEDAVVVPAGALRQDDGETVVQVARGEEREDRPVRIGLRADGQVEILDGLEPGDRVVLPDPDADPDAGAADTAGPPGEAGP